MNHVILSRLAVAALLVAGLSIFAVGCSKPNSVKDNPYATEDAATPTADEPADPAAGERSPGSETKTE